MRTDNAPRGSSFPVFPHSTLKKNLRGEMTTASDGKSLFRPKTEKIDFDIIKFVLD